MRRLIVSWVVSAVLGASTAARADDRANADAHARRGVALYNLGKYDDSIGEFEAAYTLYQSDALLFNLAQAHRQLGHCELAVKYYKRFLEGAPSPVLAEQVQSLLPKLEAACSTKIERPAGTAPATPAAESGGGGGGGEAPRLRRSGSGGADGSLYDEPSAAPQVAAAGTDEAGAEIAAAAPARGPRPGPRIIATGAATAGAVMANGTAPIAGVAVTVTTPPAWLHGGELGVAIGAARMWRADVEHDALIARLAATVRYRAGFEWGRFTLGGEVGAAYLSSLDSSSGVVPGITRGGQWAPLVRGELGAERDVARALAVRAAIAVGACPRSGAMLSPLGELELVLGLRYER